MMPSTALDHVRAESGEHHRYQETTLAGAKARRVRRNLPKSGEHVWPFYRTPAGAFIAANWRYSLPHAW